MGTKYDILILSAISTYVIASLPFTEQAVVVILGILFASIFVNPSMREFAFKMLGALNRGVFNALAKSRNKEDARTKAIIMCAAIDQYPAYMKSVVNRKRRLFFMLDQAQQRRALSTYKALQEVDVCADNNFKALTQLKAYAMEIFDISQRDLWGQQAHAYSVVEIVEHMVRDWSDSDHHGTARDSLFRPFWPYLHNSKRVLVPGSGLGRLPFELAQRLGADAIIDAPELSAPMYIGSLYATSRRSQQSLTLYPYLLEFSYLKTRKDQTRPNIVKLPSAVTKETNLRFYCEDFLTFDRGYKYDAIATLFFIDTAQNVFRYIDRIADMLAPGGVWLNYGPLKWGTAAFVEFSSDELLSYLSSSGWIIEKTWSGTNRYNGSNTSMLRTEYELIGWAARRT